MSSMAAKAFHTMLFWAKYKNKLMARGSIRSQNTENPSVWLEKII